jgi:hypothetical protein
MNAVVLLCVACNDNVVFSAVGCYCGGDVYILPRLSRPSLA